MAQRWCRVARTCHIAGIKDYRLSNRDQKSKINTATASRKSFTYSRKPAVVYTVGLQTNNKGFPFLRRRHGPRGQALSDEAMACGIATRVLSRYLLGPSEQ